MEGFWLIALKLLAVIFLVAANGLFVAAEFALVSARPTKLRPAAERGDRLTRLAYEAQQHLNYYLSSCQIGITIASLGLGWIGEPALAQTLYSFFSILPPPWDILASHALAFAIAFTVIVLLHVVLGELVPKALAIFKPEPVARWVILPLLFFSRLLAPLIWFLNESANWSMKLFGLTLPDEIERVHSAEELELLLDQSQRHGVMARRPMKIIEKVFDLPRKNVYEVMTPRPEIISLEENEPCARVMQLFIETGYVRFPVYEGRPENITGFISVRDVVKAMNEDESIVDCAVHQLSHNILYVPETMTTSTLFAQMQRDRVPMVAVVNEHSDTVGMVTLDGLAETVLGNLGEDQAEPYYEEIDAHTIRIDAQIRIEDINEGLELDLPEREEYQTLAGFTLYELKRVPKPGDELRYENWKLVVDEMSGPRIDTMLIVKA